MVSSPSESVLIQASIVPPPVKILSILLSLPALINPEAPSKSKALLPIRPPPIQKSPEQVNSPEPADKTPPVGITIPPKV